MDPPQGNNNGNNGNNRGNNGNNRGNNNGPPKRFPSASTRNDFMAEVDPEKELLMNERKDWVPYLQDTIRTRLFSGDTVQTDRFLSILRRHHAILAGGFVLQSVIDGIDGISQDNSANMNYLKQEKRDIDLYVSIANVGPLITDLFMDRTLAGVALPFLRNFSEQFAYSNEPDRNAGEENEENEENAKWWEEYMAKQKAKQAENEARRARQLAAEAAAAANAPQQNGGMNGGMNNNGFVGDEKDEADEKVAEGPTNPFIVEKYNMIPSSLYCRSFMRRNAIKSVKTFQVEARPKNTPVLIDIMTVRNCRTPIHVVNNFDLTFCQVWFDGESVFATHPEHIEQRRGVLQKSYVPVAIQGNPFLKGRMTKYAKRGFTIHLEATGEDGMTEWVPATPKDKQCTGAGKKTSMEKFRAIKHAIRRAVLCQWDNYIHYRMTGSNPQDRNEPKKRMPLPHSSINSYANPVALRHEKPLTGVGFRSPLHFHLHDVPDQPARAYSIFLTPADQYDSDDEDDLRTGMNPIDFQRRVTELYISSLVSMRCLPESVQEREFYNDDYNIQGLYEAYMEDHENGNNDNDPGVKNTIRREVRNLYRDYLHHLMRKGNVHGGQGNRNHNNGNQAVNQAVNQAGNNNGQAGGKAGGKASGKARSQRGGVMEPLYYLHEHSLESGGITKTDLQRHIGEFMPRMQGKDEMPCFDPGCPKKLTRTELSGILGTEWCRRMYEPTRVIHQGTLDTVMEVYDGILEDPKTLDPHGFGFIRAMTVCPFCLEPVNRTEGCTYMKHRSGDGRIQEVPHCSATLYVKPLFEKYMAAARREVSHDYNGQPVDREHVQITYCADCGRPCANHSHFSLEDDPKFVANAGGYGTCPGGGRKELVARLLGVRDAYAAGPPDQSQIDERVRCVMAGEAAARDPAYLARAEAILAIGKAEEDALDALQRRWMSGRAHQTPALKQQIDAATATLVEAMKGRKWDVEVPKTKTYVINEAAERIADEPIYAWRRAFEHINNGEPVRVPYNPRELGRNRDNNQGNNNQPRMPVMNDAQFEEFMERLAQDDDPRIIDQLVMRMDMQPDANQLQVLLDALPRDPDLILAMREGYAGIWEAEILDALDDHLEAMENNQAGGSLSGATRAKPLEVGRSACAPSNKARGGADQSKYIGQSSCTPKNDYKTVGGAKSIEVGQSACSKGGSRSVRTVLQETRKKIRRALPPVPQYIPRRVSMVKSLKQILSRIPRTKK